MGGRHLTQISSISLLTAGRSPLAAEVEGSLRQRCGVSGGRVLVAVSGGPDSLTLLWILAALRDRHPGHWTPIVAHVDHGIRAESGQEAEIVRGQAAAAGVPAVVRRIDCSGEGNLLAVARTRRAEALASIAAEHACPVVATAHHADDQFETLLAAISRGTGLEGLAGMPPRRNLAPGIDLVRPMLTISRASIEAFVARLRLDPIRDPSNSDPRRLRGRLRATVMPELDAIFPHAASRAASTAEQCGLAREAIERWLRECFGDASLRRWRRGELARLPLQLRAAGLRRAALHQAPELAGPLTSRLLREVAEAIGDGDERPRRWSWPGGLRAIVDVREVSLEHDGSRHGQGEAASIEGSAAGEIHDPRHSDA